MNDMTETLAPLGHNLPPANLVEELQERYKSLLDQFAEVKAAAESAPDSIADDATQSKVAELIKKLRFVEKTLDGARELEREPHAKKVTEVNGFFKTRIDPLEALRRKLNERSAAYLEKKAAAEKRRLAEEEEKRRQEAAASLRLAQEAERTKNAASVAVNEYVSLADAAKIARASATTDVDDAAAQLATAKAAVGRVQAEWLGLQADFARRAQAGIPADADLKEAAKLEYGAALTNAKWDVGVAENNLEEAKERAAAARAEQEKIEEIHRDALRQVKSADRDVEQHLGNALKDEKRADKIAEVIEGPQADLARTRSEHGAVSTLGSIWTWAIVDKDKLDKVALWHLIDTAAIEVALGKWMRAQPDDKRVMPGAVFERETVGQVR